MDSDHQALNPATDGTDPQERQDAVDLSEINTVTHTFVRSSALDILAQFPKTETVSATEDSKKQTMLNAIKEDAQCEQKSDCVDSNPKCSQSVDQLSSECKPEQNEVISWSSTSDIKKKHKKGLFSHNKKVKNSSGDLSGSNSTVQQLGNQEKTKKEKKKIRKEKAKSAQPGGWLSMNIFGGKNTVTEEKPTETKSKNKKKPLQKSQSYDTNSLPRSSQLNRMDSFRKLFKRPRDSAALAETKPIDNVKCVEISSPILKSDFKSKNLVDREVFLRERAYQVDKRKVNRVESGVPNVNNDDTSVNNDSHSNNKKETESEICNGDIEPQDKLESRESPKAPLRHKHLQKKQRLSLHSTSEGVLQDDLFKNNENNNENCKQEIDKNTMHAESDTKKDEEINVQSKNTNNNESAAELLNESKLNRQGQSDDNTYFANEANGNIERNLSQSERPCEVVNHQQVSEMDISNEQQTIDPDHIVNMDYVLVESAPGDSSTTVTPNTTQTKTGECIASTQSPKVQCRDSPPQSPEGEFNEVFVDCVNDETVSLDSATVLVDKPQEAKDKTNGISMPAGRWNSDVTSRASQRAITAAIQKKPASFSGGNSGKVHELSLL